MEIKIEVPPFTPESGIKYKWEDNFTIKVNISNGIVNIESNREGLISLANHLLNLSQENVPVNYHIHLDEYNSLEEGSAEIVIQKI